MKAIKYLPFLLLLLLCSCGMAEGTEVTEEIETSSVIEPTTTQTSSTACTTASSAQTTVTTVTTTTAETSTASTTAEDTEYMQNFEAVEFVRGNYFTDPYPVFDGTETTVYENEIDFYIKFASKLENNVLGTITDEQDLTAKSREVFISVLGQDFIDKVEADYYEIDGVKLKFIERTTPVYYVKYYEEYDVWYIVPYIPNGTLENGKRLDRIYEWPPFMIVRGSDGKIIGCRF